MNTTLFQDTESPRTDIAVVWRQAIRGDKVARATLLRRIMAPASHDQIDRTVVQPRRQAA